MQPTGPKDGGRTGATLSSFWPGLSSTVQQSGPSDLEAGPGRTETARGLKRSCNPSSRLFAGNEIFPLFSPIIQRTEIQMSFPYWLLLITVMQGNQPQTTVVPQRFATLEECQMAAEQTAALVATPKLLICDQVSARKEFSTVQGTWR
jgi:hypothetical protein